MSYYDPDDYFDDYGIEEDPSGLMVYGHLKQGPNGPVSTDKAILWVTLNGDEEWIPRSQIYSISDDCVHITDWLADQKSWDHTVNTVKPTENKDYNLDDDIPF